MSHQIQNHVKTIKKILKKINITFVNITHIIYPDKQERLKINKKMTPRKKKKNKTRKQNGIRPAGSGL